ncbi:NAD-dependent epimerase/dehydratase family protein [Kitasatospora sp. NBC_00315]|uniref:NAD-dependent epimerase/dehydratase family protein n=1 Tax=Kitasatospora sp. NBC_00315 TaxID=2975963 RepID=UPI0032470CE0
MISSVLVTGGQGYLGSVLSRHLIERGVQVTIVDSGTVVGPRIDSALATYIEGDVVDPDEWRGALKGVDAVVHLAAMVGDPACEVDPEQAWEINYHGTIRVAESCRRMGVGSLVFASTCSNYGATGEVECDEFSPLNPQSVYAQSKVMAEHYLLSLVRGDLATSILRFATVHGISPRMRFDLAVNVMTANAVAFGEVVVNGGLQWRPFIHIDDVSAVIMRSLHTARVGPPVPRIYNCGSESENYRMIDIGRMIVDTIPDARLTVRAEALDRRNYKVRFDRAASELGFVARHRVLDSVKGISAAMSAGQYADFLDMPYSNLLSARVAAGK